MDEFDQPLDDKDDKHTAIFRQALTSFFSPFHKIPFLFFTNRRKK